MVMLPAACCLLIAVNKHAETNQEIAANGCLVLCILAWSLREMKEFLGEIGACESVVYVSSLHIGDPLVSEYGSRAIALLGKNNIANSLRLSNAGAIEVLAQTGNFGFNLRHPRCLAVATNVCMGVAHLSEAANAGKLLDCGMPGLLVALMRFHYEQREFASAAVKALCALSSLNVQHREELGRSGGCEIIIEVLQRHGDCTSILLEGCETILHMSLSPTNSTKLAAVGACELLVEALRDKLMDEDFGAEVCTGAMLNLSLYGTTTKESRAKLVADNAANVLRKTQLSTKASYRARENILKLLELFGNDASSLMPPQPPLPLTVKLNSAAAARGGGSGPGSPIGGGSPASKSRSARSASWDVPGSHQSKTTAASGRSSGASGRGGVTTLAAAAAVSGSDREAAAAGQEEPRVGVGADGGARSRLCGATYAGESSSGISSGATATQRGEYQWSADGRSTVGKSSFVGVIHGSEMKGDTVPLQVEVREVIEYDSFHTLTSKQKAVRRKDLAAAAAAATAAPAALNMSGFPSSGKYSAMEPPSPGYHRQDTEDSASIRNSSGVYEI